MKDTAQINLMACDPETGICEIPGAPASDENIMTEAKHKPVRLLYFTDPICSSCWGIEPQLRKLKMEYGDYFDIDYRMGGLLKSWDTYGGSDVNGPTSVAQHWEEAGDHYGMPIDGDVWFADPLDSSYPPSIAFKAAQFQGEDKASAFLRRIKEMVFLEKKNIARWENLQQAAIESGLDAAKFQKDFDENAQSSFEEDLALARALGVRGFPTIFFTDTEGNRLLVYGSKPYQSYEQTLLKLYPEAKKQEGDIDYKDLFGKYPTFTTKEFAVVTNKTIEEAEAILNGLVAERAINKSIFRKGVLWTRKNDS